MVFEQVCADLEAEGYEVQSFVIPACGVGAPHQRYRVWFVAMLLPTVQTQGLKQCKRGETVFIPIGMLPTPKARDYQSPGNHGTGGQDLRTVISSRTGGTSQLNPLFVAEMMGFPTDWTVLPFQAGESNLSKGSEMPSCRK